MSSSQTQKCLLIQRLYLQWRMWEGQGIRVKQELHLSRIKGDSYSERTKREWGHFFLQPCFGSSRSLFSTDYLGRTFFLMQYPRTIVWPLGKLKWAWLMDTGQHPEIRGRPSRACVELRHCTCPAQLCSYWVVEHAAYVHSFFPSP